jgi:lipid-A-disaccharide synthase
MKPKSFMVIAGEASGDVLAAELVCALRQEFADAEAIPTADYQPLHTSLEPRFFGAGGPRMAAEGVDLALDLTAHSVVGLSDVLKKPLKFGRLFRRLFELALERQPDAVICVDFSEFNFRFAHAIRQYTRAHADWFHDWNPKIIRYPSPQVWASREGRA